jgi:hypothetical protein
MSFLEYYDKNYFNKLDRRAKTFRKIFELLENKHKDYYLIVETGCARRPNNFSGDGMSTVLFDKFVNHYDGKVISVDIEKTHVDLAKGLTSEKTVLYCEDSVRFLWGFKPETEIDLLYLDSFDIEFGKPHPSMLHHMKEFCAIVGKLSKGTIIVVDDHKNDKSGKGAYISNLMKNLGYERVINDYQIGWIL